MSSRYPFRHQAAPTDAEEVVSVEPSPALTRKESEKMHPSSSSRIAGTNSPIPGPSTTMKVFLSNPVAPRARSTAIKPEDNGVVNLVSLEPPTSRDNAVRHSSRRSRSPVVVPLPMGMMCKPGGYSKDSLNRPVDVTLPHGYKREASGDCNPVPTKRPRDASAPSKDTFTTTSNRSGFKPPDGPSNAALRAKIADLESMLIRKSEENEDLRAKLVETQQDFADSLRVRTIRLLHEEVSELQKENSSLVNAVNEQKELRQAMESEKEGVAADLCTAKKNFLAQTESLLKENEKFIGEANKVKEENKQLRKAHASKLVTLKKQYFDMRVQAQAEKQKEVKDLEQDYSSLYGKNEQLWGKLQEILNAATFAPMSKANRTTLDGLKGKPLKKLKQHRKK